MEELKANLGVYGKVITCEGNDELFTVLITDGFDNNAGKAYNCMKIINDAVGDKYPMMKSCNITQNKFHYVVKP